MYLRSELAQPFYRVLFHSAIDVLKNCESQEGAVLRSKFVLAETLQEMGHFEKSDNIRREIWETAKLMDALVGRNKKMTDLKEEDFEKFVLNAHR